MGKSLQERLIDPNSPDRRPRRAAYALPTFFTAANVFLGFYAIIKAFEGVMLAMNGTLGKNPHFESAAMAIGLAVFCDGIDGRLARMTNTVSDFGRELDSLADVITFGIAPAVLAFTWGIHFIEAPTWQPGIVQDYIRPAGYFLSFLYLLCGSMRLARFNIQKNPVPKNPGRPDRKYFVGLAIPAAAGLVASIIYACDGAPLTNYIWAGCWLALLGLLSFLMISTWRYPSFKDINLLRPRSPLTFIVLGSFIFLLRYWTQPLLLGMSVAYVSCGILIRIGGVIRRRFRPTPRHPEHQVG